MTTMSSVQRQADSVFNQVGEYAILDTVTYTVDSNGERTNTTSSKTAVKCVMQSLVEEDQTRITAGHIPKSDVKAFLSRAYTLHAGRYLSGTDTKQMFLYYPTNNSATLPSTAYKKYEVTMVENVGNTAHYTPNNTADINKVYTCAYLKEVMATS